MVLGISTHQPVLPEHLLCAEDSDGQNRTEDTRNTVQGEKHKTTQAITTIWTKHDGGAQGARK